MLSSGELGISRTEEPLHRLCKPGLHLDRRELGALLLSAPALTNWGLVTAVRVAAALSLLCCPQGTLLVCQLANCALKVTTVATAEPDSRFPHASFCVPKLDDDKGDPKIFCCLSS